MRNGTLLGKAIPATALAVLAACSNQQVYTAVQENQRLECARLPQAQYEDCMRELEGSYDDYERAREEYLEEERRKD